MLGLPGDRRLPAVRRARDGLPPRQPVRCSTTAAQFTAKVVAQLDDVPLPSGTLLNINVPAGEPDGVAVTRLGKRIYRDELAARTPRTRTAAGATGSTAREPGLPRRAGHRPRRRARRADRGDAGALRPDRRLGARRAGAATTSRGCSRPPRATSSEPRRRRTSARAPRSCAEQLRHHGYRYYVLDDPEVDDDVYDALLDELRAHRGRAPRAASRPTRRPSASAASRSSALDKVTHLLPMLSLANARSEEELRAWIDAHAQPPRARGHRRPDVHLRRASRRSTGWRSRCSTATACSSAAPRAATARSARTSRTTCARSARSRCASTWTTRRRCWRCAARCTCRWPTSRRSTSAGPRRGCRRS